MARHNQCFLPRIVITTSSMCHLYREVFLTGWGGADHDHGVHAIVYGPDGNYYFNNGDRGLDVTDRGGQRVVSGPDEKYYGGSALRVRPDGTGLEVVAHNFRNPYELTIDSFGNIWQSDNDDDGNEWVRINYVMEGGNHGYWGPGGKRWREDRGSHFHQEDPGVVPTLLRTGAGSPSGITIYEGNLLPRPTGASRCMWITGHVYCGPTMSSAMGPGSKRRWRRLSMAPILGSGLLIWR